MKRIFKHIIRKVDEKVANNIKEIKETIKAIKEVSIKEMKDYYYIYIKGYKNKCSCDNENPYNKQYGNFFIETDISKKELTLENKKSEISKDNNRYIIVTIN